MSAGLQITGWPAHDSVIGFVLFGPDETSVFSLGIDGKVIEWSLQNQDREKSRDREAKDIDREKIRKREVKDRERESSHDRDVKERV
ncbi:WD repeat-containing protein 91-like protein [Tanacetum coccineum]